MRSKSRTRSTRIGSAQSHLTVVPPNEIVGLFRALCLLDKLLSSGDAEEGEFFFRPARRSQTLSAWMDNQSGDRWTFARRGRTSALLLFAHETEEDQQTSLSDLALPPALRSTLVKLHKRDPVTIALVSTGGRWVVLASPAGRLHLSPECALLSGSPDTFVALGTSYYDRAISLAVVKTVYAGRPLPLKQAGLLSNRAWHQIVRDCGRIDYPVLVV